MERFGKPRHGRQGRRLSERDVSESNPDAKPKTSVRGVPRLRCASLGMTDLIAMSLIRVIEALLFSAQKPLSIRELMGAIKEAGAEDESRDRRTNEFERVSQADIAAALEQLKIEYIEQQRAFQLNEKADGWQLATNPKYAQWVRQLFPAPKPARLSAPALETLAIIAYRQPIMRADVEAVRGVNIDGVLQTLMERGLVKIAGRAEIPGRPLLYETTQFFLEHFGLRNLDELPNVDELRARHLPKASQPPVGGADSGSPGSPTPATPPES
jgi:segregation and condensation protein B